MNQDNVVKTIQKNNYIGQIVYDTDPGESPRDWDNLGTMVCFHNRYNLGDYNEKTRKHGKDSNVFYDVDDFQNWIKENSKEIAVILPLYLYDHSGITMSTGRGYPFNDMWDSGQVGYIFVTKEELKKEYSSKIVTKKIKTMAESCLKGEVEVFDQYLRGEVFGYKLFRVDDESAEEVDFEEENPEDYGEELDSCWGFYGEEHVTEELNSLTDWYVKKDEEKLHADHESKYDMIALGE